jgi:hypothetical protein
MPCATVLHKCISYSSKKAAKKGLAEADKVIASGASAEADKIAAKIQLEVFSAILAATK